eukprot:5501-Heterococcus_DN1.PRE.2
MVRQQQCYSRQAVRRRNTKSTASSSSYEATEKGTACVTSKFMLRFNVAAKEYCELPSHRIAYSSASE